MTHNNISSSFRDPSGSLFFQNGILYRSVNNSYRENYDLLNSSGLYKELAGSKLIVSHEEVDPRQTIAKDAYKVLKPQLLPFISYPYEWCFDQLKDAALHTLKIQKIALKFGMSLKDASSYNIQFHNGSPIFIDTLSFETYREGSPWVAYQQFCRHFLAPLALMKYKDLRLGGLLKNHIDGIPLDLASSLLPFKTRLKFSILTHIHIHAKSQSHFADKTLNTKKPNISRHSFLALIDSLESSIKSLKIQTRDISGWTDYYDKTNYSESGFEHKKKLIDEFIEIAKPKTLWDLGANTGTFSKIASNRDILTLSFDFEHSAVNDNYLNCKKYGDKNMLPLILDLTNPSPAIGWANTERDSIVARSPKDTAMGLALIHHLAISNNVPLHNIAEFFSQICEKLIIEFVPKNDSKVQKLLSTREDIFPDYTIESFEKEFGKFFSVLKSSKVKDSERTLFLMKKKG